jgi:hypothetical protein
VEDVPSGVVHDLGEVLTDYRDPRSDLWTTVVMPILKRIPLSRLIIKATGLFKRQIQRLRNGHARAASEEPNAARASCRGMGQSRVRSLAALSFGEMAGILGERQMSGGPRWDSVSIKASR